MASAAQILARREERQGEQVALLATGLPVVSLTVVTPGRDKDDDVARRMCVLGAEAVDRLLAARGWPVARRLPVAGPAGPELLLAVDAPARELKEACVALEEGHPVGRLWDIDVLGGLRAHGLPGILGRRDLGLPSRRCLMCAAEAAACGRGAAHPLPLLLAEREAVATGHAVRLREGADKAADLAVAALLYEARLTPKPGLVDAATPGAHTDMDLPLLERSARLLRPWLRACWLLGAARPGQVEPLVSLGIAAEAAMRAGTGGVNTHRGALFSLGLLLAAQGAAATERSTASSVPAAALGRAAVLGSPEHLALKLGPASLGEVCARVAGLAAPLLERWRETALVEPVDPSHGAAALRDLGVTGARGEAVSGFATALDVGLPAYRDRLAAHGDPDDAARWALVRLIAVNADTNLVARGGATGLDFARAWATGVAERAPGPVALVNELAAADAEFTRRNLSPGGSADLLALTWLLRSRPEA